MSFLTDAGVPVPRLGPQARPGASRVVRPGGDHLRDARLGPQKVAGACLGKGNRPPPSPPPARPSFSWTCACAQVSHPSLPPPLAHPLFFLPPPPFLLPQSLSQSDSAAAVKARAGAHPLGAISWHRVLLDESHNIKTSSAEQTKACLSLVSDRRWCCSGEGSGQRARWDRGLPARIVGLMDEPARVALELTRRERGPGKGSRARWDRGLPRVPQGPPTVLPARILGLQGWPGKYPELPSPCFNGLPPPRRIAGCPRR